MASYVEYVADNTDELDELEVTETDAALLRELLEELENEEEAANKDETSENRIAQMVLEESETTIDNVFHQQPEYPCNVYDSGWVETIDANSLLDVNTDVSTSDWYGGDDAVGIVGFELCNNVGDYSYTYNEMSYGCLWDG